MKRSMKTKLRVRFVLLALLGLFLLIGAIVSVSIYQNYRDMVKKIGHDHLRSAGSAI